MQQDGMDNPRDVRPPADVTKPVVQTAVNPLLDPATEKHVVKTEIRIFDLNDNVQLTEIERLKNNPGKYRIIIEETIYIPMRHVQYQILSK
jgi:hypothetical protein